MKNEQAWENEYKKSKLITQSDKPQKDFLRFIKWIKKNKFVDLYDATKVLDLGCGTGRNSYYMADHYDAHAIGWDFSQSAIELGKRVFKHRFVELSKRDISRDFPLEDSSVDIILDITASNALNEKERENYLLEMNRVLKKDGCVYVRTLSKDGDTNAKDLIKKFPGSEKDTYIHPELKVTERVFSRVDFEEMYGEYFEIKEMTQKTGYQKFGNQRYKRNYWNVYLTKK